MTDQDLANLLIFDAVSHEVALDAAEHGEITPALRADAEAIGAVLRTHLAAMRRRELAQQPAARPGAAGVRPSILAMTRDAVLARLAELGAQHPGAIFAHRDFAVLTDGDLRTALEDAETARGAGA